MWLRIIIAGVLLVVYRTEPAQATLIKSAVFSGKAGATAYHTTTEFIPQWNANIYVNRVADTEVVQLSKLGQAMVDVSDSSYASKCHYNGAYMDSCSEYVSSQGIAHVTLSGGLRPTIDLTGSSSNAYAYASGSISYFFRLDKLVQDAPDELVPIRMSGSGSLSQTKDYASASVTVGYQGPNDPGLVELRHEQTSAYTPKINFNYFYTEWLKSNEMAKVSISAGGWAATPYIPPPTSIYHGEFQAILDPQIEIAPNFYLKYHDQSVPAVNLYSLTFSPEMEAPIPEPTVPEPASYTLVGLGLILMAKRCWKSFLL